MYLSAIYFGVFKFLPKALQNEFLKLFLPETEQVECMPKKGKLVFTVLDLHSIKKGRNTLNNFKKKLIRKQA